MFQGGFPNFQILLLSLIMPGNDQQKVIGILNFGAPQNGYTFFSQSVH